MNNHSENKELIKHFLNRSFFKDFSTPNIENETKENKTKLFNNVEFQLTSQCNLKCKYCYYNSKLNPEHISKRENLLTNIDAILEYFRKNNYFPEKIDIFGGEILLQHSTYDIIEKIIKFYGHTTKRGFIAIPTNMSFLRNEKLVEKLENLKEKANKNGVKIGISASVDGKYMDFINRPSFNVSDQKEFYNDEFYNTVFQYSKEKGCGFHPMVYYDNIERWKDNFLWFQRNFKEYDIPWNKLYLLEVRNDGWTKKSINHYVDFYKFVLEFVIEKLNYDKELFIKGFILNGADGKPNIDRMNLFNNTGRIGRGIGCSLQTTLNIRLGDLTCNSCHRLSYDMFNGFKFIKNKDNEIIDIEPLNLSFYFATMTTDHRSWPYCESCLIKEICAGGCMGAQHEAMGDAFTPIPSVCLLEHGKVKAQIEFLNKYNMLADFMSLLQQEQAKSFELFNNFLK